MGEPEVLVFLWRDMALLEEAVILTVLVMIHFLEWFCLNFPKSTLIQLS